MHLSGIVTGIILFLTIGTGATVIRHQSVLDAESSITHHRERRATACDDFTVLVCPVNATLCNWIQSTEDDLDWTPSNSSTGSANTGPSKDVSGDEGGKLWFLYV